MKNYFTFDCLIKYFNKLFNLFRSSAYLEIIINKN